MLIEFLKFTLSNLDAFFLSYTRHFGVYDEKKKHVLRYIFGEFRAWGAHFFIPFQCSHI